MARPIMLCDGQVELEPRKRLMWEGAQDNAIDHVLQVTHL